MARTLIKKHVLFFCFYLFCLNYLSAQDSLQRKSNFSWSVFVDVYYSYDFNNPPDHEKASFVYNHKRHNEVNINLALASIAYRDLTKRASFGIMAGTYAQYNLAAEPQVLQHIYEAYVGVRLTKNKELWIDAGIMPSHIGFESAITNDCWTLTRSIAAENSPYYETGVRFSYKTPSQKWYMALLILNGWQRIRRVNGNNIPSFGTQLTYTPTENLTINSSSFIGNDKPDSVKQMRYFHDLYGIFQISEKLSLTAGFDIGVEQKTTGSSQMNTWYTPVLILRYKFTPRFTIAGRIEYYNDKEQVIVSANSPNGFQTFGTSVNIDYNIQKNLFWRIEARTLKSRDEIFESGNNFSTSSTWLTTSLSLAF